MLTTNAEEGAEQAFGQVPSEMNAVSQPNASGEASGNEVAITNRRSFLARALRIEWLGQTVASICWIASVLAYGISASADWLQLMAASAWLLANIASLVSEDSE